MIATIEKTNLNLVDAGITELARALSTGRITCVDLVIAYLDRISVYDCRGLCLNSVPILNPHVLDEAAASDERRAKGISLGLLDGIPFTVKDSYKVKGMTVACGSPAFQDLISNEDAFTVHQLRRAGAVLLGKTNMCPMAAGGMQRGVYGRAESPYNLDYLPAAFASGSSNGSGVSTAASFAAFGMGEETVSSGRSPASNNGLIAYTPSRGAISIRGNWPLYPTCDVVVPHTRSMDDLFAILDTISATDRTARGDFWRDQKCVPLPSVWKKAPASFRTLTKSASLEGLRVAVPMMYIGDSTIKGCAPVYTSPAVLTLYERARSDLEKAGATVVEVADFPLIRHYELANTSQEVTSTEQSLPADWNTIERSMMIAYAWEQFLQENNDHGIPSVRDIDHRQIYPPHPADDPQMRYTEPLNRIHYDKVQSLIDQSSIAQRRSPIDARSAMMSIPKLKEALTALESMRKTYFEDWLAANDFDLVAFPACGDVGKSDADVNLESAEHAWRNGVKYSNGNRAIRHLGIPTVTVPMGNIPHTDMPVGLTFLAKSGEDINLLQHASTYERISKRRTSPKLTPSIGLGTDQFLTPSPIDHRSRTPRPALQVEHCSATPTSRDRLRISIEGFVTCASNSQHTHTTDLELDILIDAQPVSKDRIALQRCHGTVCGREVYDFRCTVVVPEPPRRDLRNVVAARARIARDSTMVVVSAREGRNGWKSAWLRLL